MAMALRLTHGVSCPVHVTSLIPAGLSPSREGTTVFLKARTSPSGHPKRKRSAISKSNLPRAPAPSSIVELLERQELGSFLSTLAWRLQWGTCRSPRVSFTRVRLGFTVP